MKKYKLIESRIGKNTKLLPVFYKKMNTENSNEKELYFNSSTLYIKSERHQTNFLASTRFYKHITLLDY